MRFSRILVLIFALSSIVLPFQNCGQLAPYSGGDGISGEDVRTDGRNDEEGAEAEVELDPEAPLNLRVNDTALFENRSSKITVQINKPLESDLTFEWETVEGTADSYLHVEPLQGQGVIEAGQTEVDVLIPIIQSSQVDIDFHLRIISVSEGEISRDEARAIVPAGSVPFRFVDQVSRFSIVAVNVPSGALPSLMSSIDAY